MEKRRGSFMIPEWKQAADALQRIEVRSNHGNKPVSIGACGEGLRCIGIGTDAAVFQYDSIPAYAYKVYSQEAIAKKKIEENVYLRLKGSPYFPCFYGSGDNYLVLSYEQGLTLYDCLLKGISVPKRAILDVEEARHYARKQGLNPRDIHLKNVLLQKGRAKVLDVSEYVKEGNDKRWEHLMWAYYRLYPLIEGKKIPSWVLDTIKRGYDRIGKRTFGMGVYHDKYKA
jgi:hypothetical protein